MKHLNSVSIKPAAAQPCVRSEASKAAFIFIADHQFSFATGAFAEIHL